MSLLESPAAAATAPEPERRPRSAGNRDGLQAAVPQTSPRDRHLQPRQRKRLARIGGDPNGTPKRWAMPETVRFADAPIRVPLPPTIVPRATMNRPTGLRDPGRHTGTVTARQLDRELAKCFGVSIERRLATLLPVRVRPMRRDGGIDRIQHAAMLCRVSTLHALQ